MCYARFNMHAIKYMHRFFEPGSSDILVRRLCMRTFVSCISIAFNKIYSETVGDECIIIYLYVDRALH